MTKKREPWNKGRAIGPKKAFSPGEVKAILDSFSDTETFDRCLFMIAIDSMLRANDLLSLRVCDVFDDTRIVRDHFFVKQKKTNTNVAVSLTLNTHFHLIRWIMKSPKENNDFLFAKNPSYDPTPISKTTYRRLVKSWARRIDLQEEYYSSHSLRRTKASWLYAQGVPLEYIALLLGHRSTNATNQYLGLDLKVIQQITKEKSIFPKSLTEN